MEEQILTLTCISNEGDPRMPIYNFTENKQYKGRVDSISVMEGIAYIYVSNNSKREVNVRLGRFQIK